MGKLKNNADWWEGYLHYIDQDSYLWREGIETGWYYADETEDLNEPYLTKGLAKSALITYASNLEKPYE